MSRGPPMKTNEELYSNVPVHYKLFDVGALRTEYFATLGNTAVGNMRLRPDSLEVVYTFDIGDVKCSNCKLLFDVSFSSKRTVPFQPGASSKTIDGLTFGERNDAYLAWATQMEATLGSEPVLLNVSTKLGAEVESAVEKGGGKSSTGSNGGEGGVQYFDKDITFYTELLPEGATSVRWDPVLGTTEFGATLDLESTSGPDRSTSESSLAFAAKCTASVFAAQLLAWTCCGS
eukprot:TRINITY_DN12920_c0_g1_i1.p1 TRINITY_DN12920_c0_g1~~TRINITY_DN12920_c0_g1_i1.p1  ORF type:complete len:232 (-),score=28.29 TRINITY_DN12920_c0_g1_i1:101-796(-)